MVSMKKGPFLKHIVLSTGMLRIHFPYAENEPPHDKTNKMACASSEDSDQPGHPPSQIRVFTVRIKLGTLATH